MVGYDRKARLEIMAVRNVLPRFREPLEFAFEYPNWIGKLKEAHCDIKRALNSY